MDDNFDSQAFMQILEVLFSWFCFGLGFFSVEKVVYRLLIVT